MLLALLTLAIDLHQPQIPIHFEPNRGQVAGETEWIAKASGGTLYIKSDAVAFATADPAKTPRVMQFVGAKSVKGQGVNPTGGYSNYFDGRDEKNWRSGISHFTKVRYKDIYQGIDLLYYTTSNGQIEYDLDVAPGANVNQVELSFSGFDTIEIDPDGDLSLRLGKHAVTQRRPKILQGGKEISCSYRLLSGNLVKINVAHYDAAMPITIDPVLDFSTYFGGPGNEALTAVAVDSAGFIYVAGTTQTPASPVLNPFQQTNVVVQAPFVAKLTPNADRIIFFSSLHSSNVGTAYGLAVESSGSPVLVGTTSSPDFPLKNAFQVNYLAAYYTGFVAKFSPDGSKLVYSSYFGGSGTDQMGRAVVDSDGNLLFSGSTTSRDIPIRNAFQSSYAGGQGDCFLAKVNPAGALVFSTYFGGYQTDYCGNQTAVDASGSIYIGGESYSDDLPLKNPIQTDLSPRSGFPTAFVTKFSSDGRTLEYSTFLGGQGSGGVSSIAFNSKSEIYLGGHAYGGQFATTSNAFQTACAPDICGFLMRLDPTGQQILTSTLLSGSGRSAVQSVAIDADGSLYVGGTADSADFPSVNTLFPFTPGGHFNQNIFAARFSGDIRMLAYSTFLGGSQDNYLGGLTLDSTNRLYVAGWTTADNFPILNAFQPAYGGGGDGFLLRISDSSAVASSPLSATPGQLQFRYVQGGAPVATQSVQLSGNSVAFTASASASWLTVTPQMGKAPTNLSVSAAQLAVGNYAATITLTPAAGSPLLLPVTLTVLAPAPQLISANPAFVPLLSDSTVITFTGSGFTPQTQLLLDGGPWNSPVVYVDSRTIQTTMSYLSFIGPGSYSFSAVNPQSDTSTAVTVSVGGATPVITSVVNAASQVSGSIAPGELIMLTGTDFGPANLLTATIGGISATIISSSNTQALILVPGQLQGSTAPIVFGSTGLTSIPTTTALAPTAPGLFTANGSGKGPAMIQGTPSPGSTITLFGTGVADLTLPFTVTINGETAPVVSVGPADNRPGVFQLEVTIPADAPTLVAGHRPAPLSPPTVVVSVGGQPSQAGVTIPIVAIR